MIVSKIAKWGISQLAALGETIVGEMIPVRLMPWSKVWRIQTRDADYFLKYVNTPFDIELVLLPALYHEYPSVVPKVLAVNRREKLILMSDHGIPFRDKLKTSYDKGMIRTAFDEYTTLQRTLEENVNNLLKMGLPDWRVSKLPLLFEIFLKEKRDLLIQDGLAEDEIEFLTSQLPKFISQCKTVVSFNIPSTLEHGDFHDNNILIDDDKLCINDWGDAVVTHPFFSLHSFLISAERQHQIGYNSALCFSLRDHYLSRWGNILSPDELVRLFEFVRVINPIKFVLSFSRIADCNKNALDKYRGYMAEALREWLKE